MLKSVKIDGELKRSKAENDPLKMKIFVPTMQVKLESHGNSLQSFETGQHDSASTNTTRKNLSLLDIVASHKKKEIQKELSSFDEFLTQSQPQQTIFEVKNPNPYAKEEDQMKLMQIKVLDVLYDE